MDTSAVLRELAAAGVNAWPDSADSLATETGATIRLSSRSRPPTPDDIERDLARAEHDKVFYWVRSLTPGLHEAVRHEVRVAAFAVDTSSLWLDMVEHRPSVTATPTPPPGRKPFARHAIARTLLLAPEPMTQTHLATEAGVSQSAVSTALRALGTSVHHERAGTVAADWPALWSTCTTEYPGPGGVTTYWWHDGSLEDQAARLTRRATGDGVVALVSGDLSARRIAPWRQPEHVTVYLDRGLDPGLAGFALASRDDHTLSVTVPHDRTIFATAAAHPSSPGHADPVLVAHDVAHSGTTGDEGEAVTRIRDVLQQRWNEHHETGDRRS